MNEYLVVLNMPDYLCATEGYGDEIFVTTVLRAKNHRDAVEIARGRAKSKFDPHDCYDFKLVLVVENGTLDYKTGCLEA